MTHEERARQTCDYLIAHRWVRKADRAAVAEGIELAIRAAVASAAVDAVSEDEREAAYRAALEEQVRAGVIVGG